MKKIILPVVCLITLVSMSFAGSNSNKIVDTQKPTVLKNDFKLSDFSNLKGRSVGQYPGTSTTIVIDVNSEKEEVNNKMNNVIKKY